MRQPRPSYTLTNKHEHEVFVESKEIRLNTKEGLQWSKDLWQQMVLK